MRLPSRHVGRGPGNVGLVLLLPLLLVAGASPAADFLDELKRIDQALAKNPTHAEAHALESCRARRNAALELYEMGQVARAERRLEYCMETLHLPTAAAFAASKPAVPTHEEIEANAARELERALAATPDIDHGLAIYRECAACHMPEGWGLSSGMVPQLAGQHRKVVIKQLADIRAGNRENPLMAPYSSFESIGGAQAVADVAGYIDTLEISVENGRGKGDDLEFGEKLYAENCARCHGPEGEGDADRYIPRIQSQHYEYLVRQFEWIKQGKRRNADPEMVTQIEEFDPRETHAVLDWVSRLEPPEALQAPPGWRNPDFAE